MRWLPLLSIFYLLSCTRATQSEMEATADVIPEKEIVCFVYHRFGDDRFPSTNILLTDFEAHLSWLNAHDYQVLSFSEAIVYLKSPAPALKTAVITIDDGYKSFFTNGLSLLKKYDMPATLFINTKTVGGNDYMDWTELRSAYENGVEIGNHTHSHTYFLNLPEEDRHESFRRELEQSQNLIQEKLGLTPQTFAYPYGEFDEEMKRIVKEVGFLGAAAQNSGVIFTGTDLFQTPRFPMSEAYATLNQFEEKARMLPLKVLQEEPSSFILSESRPTLSLTISIDDIIPDQFQCFVQGSECILEKEEIAGDKITITLQSATPINSRRRTLYTLTAPDSSGGWHWYSHLWINPVVN